MPRWKPLDDSLAKTELLQNVDKYWGPRGVLSQDNSQRLECHWNRNQLGTPATVNKLYIRLSKKFSMYFPNSSTTGSFEWTTAGLYYEISFSYISGIPRLKGLITHVKRDWYQNNIPLNLTRIAPSPTPWCSSYQKESLQVTLNYGCQLRLSTTFTNFVCTIKLSSIFNNILLHTQGRVPMA